MPGEGISYAPQEVRKTEGALQTMTTAEQLPNPHSSHKVKNVLRRTGAVALGVSLVLMTPTIAACGNGQKVTRPQAVASQTIRPTETGNAQQGIITEIRTQASPQVKDFINGDYTLGRVRTYGGTWASVEVNQGETHALALFKLVGDKWERVEGPGTYFPKEDLIKDGAPEQLIDDTNAH